MMMFTWLKRSVWVGILFVVGLGVTRAEDTELGERMEEMRQAYKTLRATAADMEKVEANLVLVAALKKAAEASVALTPAKAAEVPEAERAQFVAKYQEAMRKTVTAIGRLEAALQAKDAGAASKAVAELGALSKEGHKAYKKED